MGCDIHGVIEVKGGELSNGPDSLWYGAVKLDSLLTRDYERFAYLFGVRHDPIEMDLPGERFDALGGRGTPQDVSDMARRELEEWGDDAHSPTWAYHHEIESAIEGTRFGESADWDGRSWATAVNIGQQIDALLRSNDYGPDRYETRWVVWFDN